MFGIVMLYGFGYLYYLLEVISLKNYVPFHWWVIGICIPIMAWILFKVQNSKSWSLMLQDTLLILFSNCLFTMVLPSFNMGLDDEPGRVNTFHLIIFLNLLVVNFNDWLKLRSKTDEIY